MKILRHGSDTTRAMLSCEGSSGVFSQSLRPEALDKIRSLETGKQLEQNIRNTTKPLFSVCVHPLLTRSSSFSVCVFLKLGKNFK